METTLAGKAVFYPPGQKPIEMPTPEQMVSVLDDLRKRIDDLEIDTKQLRGACLLARCALHEATPNGCEAAMVKLRALGRLNAVLGDDER